MSQEDPNLARHLLEVAISMFPDQKRGWQSRFAERLGVTPQQLSDMLNGRKGVGEVQQKRLAELGVNLHWMITGKGSMYETEKPLLRRIKVSALRTNAGGTVTMQYPEEHAYVTESAIEGDAEPLAFRVPDDTMEGIVWKGDVIFVNEEPGAFDRDLCLVTIAGEGQCIRHVYVGPDNITLVSVSLPPRIVGRGDVTIQRVIAANIMGVHLNHK